MRFYLRVINPVVALMAFGLCTWAAIYGDDKLQIFGLVGGAFGSYFFAKGIFTGGALFLLGKLLEATLEKGAKDANPMSLRAERALSLSFICATIGIFAGLFFWSKPVEPVDPPKTYEVQNPVSLKITESHLVKETDRVNVAITLVNEDSSAWDKVAVTATLYLGGQYSGESTFTYDSLQSGQTDQALIEFSSIAWANVKDSIAYKFFIEGNPRHKLK
jgi:hypothetical protein